MLAALCGFVVSAAGCNADRPTRESGSQLTAEEFIEVYVDLREAVQPGEDTATWEARKQEILREHGTTPEALQAFVDAYAGDVVYSAALWDTIQARLQPPDSARDR